MFDKVINNKLYIYSDCDFRGHSQLSGSDLPVELLYQRVIRGVAACPDQVIPLLHQTINL